MSTAKSVQPATGPQVAYKLRLASFIGLVSAFSFLSTHIVIASDKKYVFMPDGDLASYDNPPFRKLIEFSDVQDQLVAFYIRVKRSPVDEFLFAGTWDAYLESCAPYIATGDECQYAQHATNSSVHKTFSLGVLQHPGWAFVGYGVSGFGMAFCAGTVAALLGDMLLLYIAMASYSGLLYALAPSEIPGPLYAVRLLFALYSVQAFHLLLSHRLGRWYHAKAWYRCVAWASIASSCVLGIVSVATPGSFVQAQAQTATVALVVLSQLFVSHVMYLMSPVLVSIVLPGRCMDVRVSFDLNMDDVTDIEDVDTITVDTEMRAVSASGNNIAEQALSVTREGGAAVAAPAPVQGAAPAEGRVDVGGV